MVLAEATGPHGGRQRLAHPTPVEPLTSVPMLAAMASIGDTAADGGAVVGFILALIALATWVTRPVIRAVRDFATFLSDWKGEEERPGVPARPGVMEVLLKIGTDHTILAQRVGKVERDMLKLRSEVTWLLSRCRSDHDHDGGNPDA